MRALHLYVVCIYNQTAWMSSVPLRHFSVSHLQIQPSRKTQMMHDSFCVCLLLVLLLCVFECVTSTCSCPSFLLRSVVSSPELIFL